MTVAVVLGIQQCLSSNVDKNLESNKSGVGGKERTRLKRTPQGKKWENRKRESERRLSVAWSCHTELNTAFYQFFGLRFILVM